MDQIRRILGNKWTKKYYVDQIFFNGRLGSQTTNFLKNQNYIDYKGIKKILKINFLKKYPSGYVLKIKNEIVGFVGTLFSKRKIRNKNYIYCNIHTWIVNESHRMGSHLLFIPLIKKNCVITVLSLQKRLVGIFKKMGFRSLEMNYKIVFLTNYFSFFNKSLFQIEKNFTQIKKKLSKKDLKIYKDHSNASFIKFLVCHKENKLNSVLIIASFTKKKRYFNVLNILYASNKSFLKNNWNSINKEIFKTYKVFFCSQYFLKEEDCVFPKSTNFSMNFKKTICVKNLPTNFKFDTIYSETII